MERLAKYLEASPTLRIWVRLNQSATLLALVVGLSALAVAYEKYIEDKVKASEDRITKAWDTVTKMAGKGSNGGQISAIQILVKNKVSLDRVDLHNTYLAGADLQNASLRGANLSGSNLTGANLHGANLAGANLDEVTLYNGNLGGVEFDDVTLARSKLAFSKVDIAIVRAKSLRNTDLTGVAFVLEDEEGVSDFGMYADTVAESPNADNAQNLINQACAEQKFNEKQDRLLPIRLPNKSCNVGRSYQGIKNKVYEYLEY